ncbi:MAG: hypothetical protein KGH64_06030, partial [Candidatus Micrarchaeota archaeon]|nr:hypothetical protein [Candidatus Micrarchaeota archaeon]
MKERLTITLDKDLLSMIDATVDGVRVRNRSHAIEQLLIASVKQIKPKKAVIFAGGHPITVNGRQMPVPMAIVRGRNIVDYILDELKRNGISEVIIAVGKDSESLLGHLGDGNKFGMIISYVKEESPRGTEGVLELVKDRVRDGPFFALNGDNIFTIDLDDMYKQHMANKALATIALTPADSRLRFGVTKLEGNRITSFT